jgi:hypothetical protein
MKAAPDWFEDLRAKRKRWVAALDENDFERGIWNATVAKYADRTHFVFELLQNAEDEGATRATFRLEPGAIVFEHDGAPFSSDDVVGITGLGNTTKLDEANKIGCFGIGFKSVFVVTAAPQIHATVDDAPLAFSIYDLVVPERIAYAGAPGLTRVVLPLPAEDASATLDAVRAQLRTVGPRAMLFLDSLSELGWTDGCASERYGAVTADGGVRTLSRQVGNERQEQRYLILRRAIEGPDAKRALAVKIALRLNAMGEIVREAEPTRLSVFFETEEKTGLEFHLHGPFALTDNRANVRRDDPWNGQLVKELSHLLAHSLPDLRDRGLVNRSFLGVLPNERDQLQAPWTAVRDAVILAFKAEALTPAQFGGHALSTALLRGPTDLREFLGDAGLALLHGGGPRRWSISGSQRNDREDNFLTSLGVPEWGWAEFTKGLADNLYHTQRQAVTDWLGALDDDALRRLYGLLEAALRATRNTSQLVTLPIVKLEDGRFVRPPLALLPPADDRDAEGLAGSGLVLVKGGVLTGRGRKEILEFLKKLGAHEVSERDYIAALVNHHNTAASGEAERRHLRDMERFIKWWAEHKQIDPFRDKAFVRAEGVAGYVSPTRTYIDAPFALTGLAVVYDGQTERRDRLPLWSGYKRLKRETLLGFLKMCGAEDRLIVEPFRLSWSHQLRSQFPNRRETNTQRANEYSIRELQGLLDRKDPRISRLIWQAMSAARQENLLAVYQPNQGVSPVSAPSHVVSVLSNTAWIPTSDGRLARPDQITVRDLAPDFTATGNEAWLRAIRFGEAQRKHVESNQARRRAAESLGLSAEVADHLARLAPEERKAADADFLRRLRAGEILPPQFPERASENPERRAERVAQRAEGAAPKTYEIRQRSVRTSDGDARAQAKTYLRDLYTAADGSVVCQCCHQRMPFNLPDGQAYFEAVACVADEPRELPENFLALCPTCAAKWQVVNGQTPVAIRQLLAETTELAINVTLAGAPVTLRFVEMHLLDLRAALSRVAAA